MANLNRIFLIGRLTREPKLHVFDSGSKVCDLGLATSRNWKGRDDQQQEETLFVDIKVWGRQAELCADWLSKGRQIFVEGRLKLDQWEDDRSGEKRSKHIVVAERVQFLDKPPEGAGGGSKGEGKRSYGQSYDNDNEYSGRGKKDDGGGYGRNNRYNRETAGSKYEEDDVPF